MPHGVRNPTWAWENILPTAPTPHLTAIGQTGHLVLDGSPVSYIIRPGEYAPVLSPHGEESAITRQATVALQTLEDFAQAPPALVPVVRTDYGIDRTWDQALAPLPDTSLGQSSPMGVLRQDPEPEWYQSGIPTVGGLRGL